MPRINLKPPLIGRDAAESHRVATPLELLFDLCFVVAVAQAVAGLHHFAVEGHFLDGLLRYALVFFAIWWSWMNFTWFASAYDSDDIAYRIAVMIQIVGNLTLAAGIPRFFEHLDLSVSITGYVIMRLGLVELWLRAARGNPEASKAARRYAIGITLVQIGWVVRVFLPDSIGIPLFVVFFICELAIPVWAERPGMTTWNPGHIAERYGLFTLIVIGESVLVATTSIQAALDLGDSKSKLIMIAVGGLLIVFSMWWLYFDKPNHLSLHRFQVGRSASYRDNPFIFGYGHLLFFGTAAAVGGGLEVAVDFATHHTEISAHQASALIAVPVALYFACIWILRLLLGQSSRNYSMALAGAIVLTLATILLSNPVLPIGIVCALVVAWTVYSDHADPEGAAAHPQMAAD